MDFFWLTIKKEVEKYLSVKDVKEIYNAYKFSYLAHKNQKRLSGEPFITHPIGVGLILAQMRLTKKMIIAGLLHDVLEDTDFTKEDLEQKFGEKISKIVVIVSKLTHISFHNWVEVQAENLYKMLITIGNDPQVILIKIIDRLDNMRTLNFQIESKRKKIAKETLEIYAPIAHHLGMNSIFLELEDLSFANYYPLRYRVLKKNINKIDEDNQIQQRVIEINITNALSMKKIKYSLYKKNVHLYRVYQKISVDKKYLKKLTNRFDFEIIVTSIDNCYLVLGVIHRLYCPFIEKFKDYIAIPKGNKYQSIHTFLAGPNNSIIGIRIFSEEMRKIAELGIINNLSYKNSNYNLDNTKIGFRNWINVLIDLQKTSLNAFEFIGNIKNELFPKNIYVFSFDGKIFNLPHNATVLDFAYRISADTGNRSIGARINHRIYPINTKLKKGQIVEIITSPKQKNPSALWLDFAVTGKARSRIKYALRKKYKRRDSTIANLDTIKCYSSDSKINYYNSFQDFREIEENQGRCTFIIDMGILKMEHPKLFKLIDKNLSLQPIIMSKCCYPIPGDSIIGVLGREQQIEVHINNCGKLVEMKDTSNYIYLSWGNNILDKFTVQINICSENSEGILANIFKVITDLKSNIDDIIIDNLREFCTLNLFTNVRNFSHLIELIKEIKKIKGVMSVTRG